MATRHSGGPIGILRLHEVQLELFRSITADSSAALTHIASFPESVVSALTTMAGQSGDFYESVGARSPWLGYLAIEERSNELIGSAGFKGNVNKEGEVEIAYFTFSHHEGRGAATAMVKGLCRIAEKHGDVRRVIAHTLPETNASGRLLDNNGFRNVGVAEDPEDGKVWRWEKVVS